MNNNSVEFLLEEIAASDPEFQKTLTGDSPRMNLSHALYKMRRNTGLTQSEVAQSMGKDQGFVSRMESATGPFPDSASLVAFASACHYVTGNIFIAEDPDQDDVLAVALGDSKLGDLFNKAMFKHNIKEPIAS
jgi:transcriptional regulator with XRE-family HTH domain